MDGLRIRGTGLGRAALALALVGGMALGGSQPFHSGAAHAQEFPSSFADLAERLSPAVVNISTSQIIERPGGDVPLPNFPPGSPFEDFFKDFFDRQQRGDGAPRRAQSLGSGFVISEDGYVVTNNHVIEEADEISVIFNDGTSLDAELVGRDAKTDLALLKVESDAPLPFVPFGDSETARVGDWVVAIGNPFGLGGSVSVGIVSARNRDINAGPYDDFIQTDAAINRGNSGGPLFNLKGEVIGVNTAIISPSGGSIGIGFSIPSALAKNVINQLKEFGETRRGWLGVRIQTVTDEIAESLGLDSPRGALVAGVSEDGPAAAGGVETGDVILSFDGEPVDEMRALPRIVADTEVGKEVDVVVWRNGAEATLQVEIGLLNEAAEAATLAAGTTAKPDEKSGEVEALGLKLVELDDAARGRYEIGEDVKGVVIAEVDPASAAAEKGIVAGDVIVEVAQEAVETPADVAAQVAAVAETDRKSVLLLINRGGELRFVAVRLEKD